MKSTTQLKNSRALRRKRHVRRHIRQVSDLPRLSVHRTAKHISAQLIDDVAGRTLAHISSTAKAIQGDLSGKTKTERAKIIGAEIAKRALEAGVKQVVFDRGESRYHGRVKALAEAAREGGLKI